MVGWNSTGLRKLQKCPFVIHSPPLVVPRKRFCVFSTSVADATASPIACIFFYAPWITGLCSAICSAIALTVIFKTSIGDCFEDEHHFLLYRINHKATTSLEIHHLLDIVSQKWMTSSYFALPLRYKMPLCIFAFLAAYNLISPNICSTSFSFKTFMALIRESRISLVGSADEGICSIFWERRGFWFPLYVCRDCPPRLVSLPLHSTIVSMIRSCRLIHQVSDS